MPYRELRNDELLELHAESGFVHDTKGRIRAVNDFEGGDVPRFHLGRSDTGNIWRFRHDIPEDVVEELEEVCRQEPVLQVEGEEPTYRDRYIELLETYEPIQKVSTGPCFWFVPEATVGGDDPAPVETRVVSEEDTGAMEVYLNDWIECVPHWQPFVVALNGDHAVSVCASVRITPRAHAAGVETTPGARRRGFAFAAAANWAQAVERLEAVPLYSTSWMNVASRGLAKRLGLSMYGEEFNVT